MGGCSREKNSLGMGKETSLKWKKRGRWEKGKKKRRRRELNFPENQGKLGLKKNEKKNGRRNENEERKMNKKLMLVKGREGEKESSKKNQRKMNEKKMSWKKNEKKVEKKRNGKKRNGKKRNGKKRNGKKRNGKKNEKKNEKTTTLLSRIEFFSNNTKPPHIFSLPLPLLLLPFLLSLFPTQPPPFFWREFSPLSLYFQ